MSVHRPVRCLFSKATAAAAATLPKPSPTTPPHRSFQTTATRSARRKRPHYPSIKAEDLKLLNQAAETKFPKYDDAETALLQNRYTPSQLSAIKAAEAAIDARDLVVQGKNRVDMFALPYQDSLAEVDPVTDHAEKLSHRDIEGKQFFRKANAVERDEAMAQIATETLAKLYPDGIPDEADMNPTERDRLEQAMHASLAQAALDPRSVYTSKNPNVVRALADPRHNVILPSLPRIETTMVRQTRRMASLEEQEDPRQKRLQKSMGWDQQQIRKLRVKVLVSHGVVNQTRMGKIRSQYYLSIAGNGDGLLGVGEGKSVEPDEGRKQSMMAAIRNMKPVPRYENRTIYGNLEHKVGATKVQLMARPPGKFFFHTFFSYTYNLSKKNTFLTNIL